VDDAKTILPSLQQKLLQILLNATDAAIPWAYVSEDNLTSVKAKNWCFLFFAKLETPGIIQIISKALTETRNRTKQIVVTVSKRHICQNDWQMMTMFDHYQTVKTYSTYNFSINNYNYTVSQKKHPRHFQLYLENQLPNFNNCWHKYSWHNLPSNDHSVFHLTQCMLLH